MKKHICKQLVTKYICKQLVTKYMYQLLLYNGLVVDISFDINRELFILYSNNYNYKCMIKSFGTKILLYKSFPKLN